MSDLIRQTIIRLRNLSPCEFQLCDRWLEENRDYFSGAVWFYESDTLIVVMDSEDYCQAALEMIGSVLGEGAIAAIEIEHHQPILRVQSAPSPRYSYLAAEEIDRARRSLEPSRFHTEYLDRLNMPAPNSRVEVRFQADAREVNQAFQRAREAFEGLGLTLGRVLGERAPEQRQQFQAIESRLEALAMETQRAIAQSFADEQSETPELNEQAEVDEREVDRSVQRVREAFEGAALNLVPGFMAGQQRAQSISESLMAAIVGRAAEQDGLDAMDAIARSSRDDLHQPSDPLEQIDLTSFSGLTGLWNVLVAPGKNDLPHYCSSCSYFMRGYKPGESSICNAFHTMPDIHAVNECPDWESR